MRKCLYRFKPFDIGVLKGGRAVLRVADVEEAWRRCGEVMMMRGDDS